MRPAVAWLMAGLLAVDIMSSKTVVGTEQEREQCSRLFASLSISTQKLRQHGQTSEEGTSTNEEEAGTRETI